MKRICGRFRTTSYSVPLRVTGATGLVRGKGAVAQRTEFYQVCHRMQLRKRDGGNALSASGHSCTSTALWRAEYRRACCQAGLVADGRGPWCRQGYLPAQAAGPSKAGRWGQRNGQLVLSGTKRREAGKKTNLDFSCQGLMKFLKLNRALKERAEQTDLSFRIWNFIKAGGPFPAASDRLH